MRTIPYSYSALQKPKEPLERSHRRAPSQETKPFRKKEEENKSWSAHFSRFKEALLAPLQLALKNNKSERGDSLSIEAVAMQPLRMPLSAAISAAPSSSPLNPQVVELLDLMVGSMTLIDTNGISETTLTLDSPQFASSLFYGATITIQEYSTAPKAFNIHLKASPEAVSLMQIHTADLMAAFQQENSSFKLNRLEMHLLESDRPFFKRKEQVSEDKKERDYP